MKFLVPAALLVVVYATGCLSQNPCAGQVCDNNSVCIVDPVGQPVCVCQPNCTRQLKWVCGSDGKSYSNPCLLRLAACVRRRKITVVANGKCKAAGTKPKATKPKATTAAPEPETEAPADPAPEEEQAETPAAEAETEAPAEEQPAY